MIMALVDPLSPHCILRIYYIELHTCTNSNSKRDKEQAMFFSFLALRNIHVIKNARACVCVCVYPYSFATCRFLLAAYIYVYAFARYHPSTIYTLHARVFFFIGRACVGAPAPVRKLGNPPRAYQLTPGMETGRALRSTISGQRAAPYLSPYLPLHRTYTRVYALSTANSGPPWPSRIYTYV